MTKPVRPSDDAIETAMLDLAERRGAGKTICPSEVARALSGNSPEAWSPLMPGIRTVAVRLMKAGRVSVMRKGKPVDPDDFRGVYRIGVPGGGAGNSDLDLPETR